MNRREMLTSAVAAAIASPHSSIRPSSPTKVVKDYSGITSISVAEEIRPQSTLAVSEAIRDWSGPVSVGGGRFSMGGQVALPDSLHLDMRGMNRVLAVAPERRVVRLQAGATWRDLQEAIDEHDLAVSIMQSFSNFTVGGSVSVNCHGRYVNKGPLVNSVRALQVVGADGRVQELTPESNLFRGVIGGYGGLGVVTEVELELDQNSRLLRIVEKADIESYPDYFNAKIAGDSEVVFHNADLRPPRFDEPRLISWITTDEHVTVPERLIPRDRDYTRNRNLIWAVSELPGGKRLRRRVEDRLFAQKAVVWRNYEASLDTESLEPRTRLFSTYLLQEYFIPVGNFVPFVRSMVRVLRRNEVNALNVSIRHSPPDQTSLMTWAPTEVFSFVLYYKQRNTQRARREAELWTRELIDAALDNDGRYYLPYRLHATDAQFEHAYPEVREFIKLKKKVDPKGKFQNLLWEKYL
ncbi:MAG: FAD-binding oxidoreductase [Gammaproteobacteria bacterium]|nr:FAD-binding oxidoreductase [Gammaproteobacteria bacterium]